MLVKDVNSARRKWISDSVQDSFVLPATHWPQKHISSSPCFMLSFTESLCVHRLRIISDSSESNGIVCYELFADLISGRCSQNHVYNIKHAGEYQQCSVSLMRLLFASLTFTLILWWRCVHSCVHSLISPLWRGQRSCLGSVVCFCGQWKLSDVQRSDCVSLQWRIVGD